MTILILNGNIHFCVWLEGVAFPVYAALWEMRGRRKGDIL